VGVFSCIVLHFGISLFVFMGRRRKCAVCADRNNTFRKSRISTWCSTCVVGLCVGDCFRKLHAGQEE
jgi:hypothetical protein